MPSVKKCSILKLVKVYLLLKLAYKYQFKQNKELFYFFFSPKLGYKTTKVMLTFPKQELNKIGGKN